MVEEEALDDDTLGDQVERGDSDWLAAHQSIDAERPGLAENPGYGCGGFACDPVNGPEVDGLVEQQSRRRRIDAEHGELVRIGLGQCEEARGGCNESFAPTEAVERHEHAIPDLQVVDAPANGQHSPHPFISDDARQRGPDRIYTLDEIQVIHVDRRVLDTDQHLAGGRCWRFGKVGKLKDDARLAESSDLHCTHYAPPVLVM